MKAIGETLHRFAPTRLFRLCQRDPQLHRCGDVVFTIAVIDDNAGPDSHNLRTMTATTGAAMVRRVTIALPHERSQDSVPTSLNVLRHGRGRCEKATQSDECSHVVTGRLRGAAKPGRSAKCPLPPRLCHGFVTEGVEAGPKGDATTTLKRRSELQEKKSRAIFVMLMRPEPTKLAAWLTTLGLD